jgi:hypothetical protein
MGIGQTIRNVAGGVGSAVQKASRAMDAPFVDKPAVTPAAQETTTPAGVAKTGAPIDPMDSNHDGIVSPTERRAWEIAGHALIPSQQGGRSGFELPDIENAADPTGKPNPFYIPKTRKNAKGADEPNPDYVDASNIHRAMETLDRIHTENNPHIDYAKEYQGIINDQAKIDAQPKRGNALSAFAIALGGGPEAAQQYAATNRAEDQSDTDKASKALEFKKSLVDAHVKQLVEQGKWKEAIQQNEVSRTLEQQLAASSEERKHLNRMAENEQLIGGRSDVAHTNANARIRAVQERVHGIAMQVGLVGDFQKAFDKEMGKRLAGLTTGIMNDPESGLESLPDIFEAASEIASRLRTQQDAQGGEGGSSQAGTTGGKKVQMYRDGKPYGQPISAQEFKKRGGASAAQTHGYTFKMQ